MRHNSFLKLVQLLKASLETKVLHKTRCHRCSQYGYGQHTLACRVNIYRLVPKKSTSVLTVESPSGRPLLDKWAEFSSPSGHRGLFTTVIGM